MASNDPRDLIEAAETLRRQELLGATDATLPFHDRYDAGYENKLYNMFRFQEILVQCYGLSLTLVVMLAVNGKLIAVAAASNRDMKHVRL